MSLIRPAVHAAVICLFSLLPVTAKPGGWTVIAWNDLGMHCMDGDYSVFSILPPYNNIHAQVIDPSGKLVTAPSGITVTYEAVQDTAGSINTTSVWKTDFWQFVKALFGAQPSPDTGLTGNQMPGTSNQPQPMKFESAQNWFTGDAIPLTAYDDSGNKNPYSMMRISVRNASGAVQATTDIVLPVSDEMTCRSCHASGSRADTQPSAGWANAQPFERDYKINILRLHDDRFKILPVYRSALAAAGYDAAGLSATAAKGTPVLCAACHSSNALSVNGQPGVPSLTQSMHSRHASATDPATGLTLDSAQSRDACYNCHPGSTTRCLRGIMGNSVAADGTMAIQCQNCHGSMSVVGAPRQGWLQEPNCQSCHSGTAVANTGQIRWTSVFDASGAMRTPADTRFATTANTPAAGLSLYRFSAGHAGLACEACHGSTHAEYASSHANDNVQSIAMQGHAGAITECSACHSSVKNTTNGGPHNMHVVGQQWVQLHERAAGGSGRTACQDCHGSDYRGTVLSKVLMDRTLTIENGTRQLFRGSIVGCYTCHNGPTGNGSAPSAPSVSNATASAVTGSSVSIPLAASAGTIRIVSQPAGGTVALNGNTATYFPFADFEGTDTFTYAAANSGRDSNLAAVTVTVTAPQRPVVSSGGVVNAASFQGGPVSPGELVTIFGNGMGPAALNTFDLNAASLVSRLLWGTRVLFDGLPAPLIYTSAGQVTAIVPYGIAGKATTSMTVEYNGIRSTPIVLNVAGSAPGIFTSASGQAAALNQDGITVNGAGNPAAAGSVISLFLTGEGALDTAVIDGQLAASTLWKPKLNVSATIGGAAATVSYAGAAPDNVAGLLQVNVQIPASTATGNAVPVQVAIGGTSTQTAVTIAVR
jgi:uncharacterized protein (TIGR03437 family)